MPGKSSRRIITNRQLNFTLSPVIKYNPKEMPYSLPDYKIDGTWNQHQSIVLDVMLDRLFRIFYREYSNTPKSWRSKSVIEVNKNFAGALFNPVALKFLSGKPVDAFSMHEGYDVEATEKDNYAGISDGEGRTFEEYFKDYLKNNDRYNMFKSDMIEKISLFADDIHFSLSIPNLFKNYPVLRQHPYKYDLAKIVQKIANTKFKMNYKVKCLLKAPEYNKKGRRTNAGTMIDALYEMNDYQQIFSVDLDEDHFKFNFKSPLGKLILHNMILLDTDWIEDEVLELGKNSYFIYKRFVLNRISGKNPPAAIELWFEDIKTFLDLKGKNVSSIYSAINKALKEIRNQGLIKDYNWNKNYTKQRQYKLFFDRLSKVPGDRRASKNKLLKVPS